MQTQNFKNHTQWVPGFHFGVYGGIAILLGGAIIYHAHVTEENKYAAALLVFMPFVLIGLALYARSFALKAQDRAIRAEEKLRYYIMTGQPMDSRLRTSQIVALRFAGDEEFVELVKKAAAENLRSKEIKMLIQNWKADYHRV
ncbi:DUF6526 family protein [Ferruginibacter sp. SUN002]|uniref:DUF6526 family protein n=1 Tax=Ferruginibacter sp. SUN002 TaxID=2937789 RepID=UPI003D3691E5